MILFAAANASGNTIFSLDDPTVDDDRGVAFTASLKSTSFDEGPATGFATLRQIVQAVIVASSATVVITPIGDGMEYPSQAVTTAISASSGAQQQLEVPVRVPATRFQVKVDVTAHVGVTELGQSDQWFIARRRSRNG